MTKNWKSIVTRLVRQAIRVMGLAATLLPWVLAAACSDHAASGPGAEGTALTEGALLANDVVTNLPSNEPHLAINPLDSQVVAASQFQTVSLSFDGGKTFTASVFASGPAGYGNAGGDATLAFDSKGRLFITFLLEIPCQNAANCKANNGFGAPDLFVQRIDARRPGTPGLVASRRLDAAGNDCTNGGNAAQCPVNVTAQTGLGACNDVTPPLGHSADRQYLVADGRPSCGTPTPARSTRTCSPFQDNLYLIWTDNICGGGVQMQVASSSDQGANWATQALTAGSGDFRQAGLGVGANGDVYAAYHTQIYDSDDSDGASGQIILYQSATGTAAGFVAPGNPTTPFPAPIPDITRNRQQCPCAGSTCAASGKACTFSPTTCGANATPDAGPGCECGAGDVCNPAAACPNNPIQGWRPCRRRLQTNGNMTWGSQSPYIVADATNPNNIAVFASTDPNRAGTARDNMDVQYVLATNAATATPIWSAPSNVTSNGTALPASNQLFPEAVGARDNSCVTLAYYDDRSPATDPQGNNVLDVFVAVNANLWGGVTWQPEVRIDHTPFNPDLGAPDFFSFCGGTPGCAEPAGWRKTSRMGEYFGLAVGRGIVWTGNSLNGQQILFNYSDGIPPVVTPPPTVTATTCTGIALGTATATDTCGMPPLSPATPSQTTFGAGTTTVTWTATDGALNVGTATQLVIVNDKTPPTFTFVPGATTISTCVGANIGTATAVDDCDGTIIPTNDAPSHFPLGTTTVTWKATDKSGNFVTSTELVTAVLADDPSCCPVGTNVIVGTNGPDQLNGTEGNDCILGLGGDDTINGFGGVDFISGGAGNDTIAGGFGADYILGGDGNDTIDSGPDDDFIDGGHGTDTCSGGTGTNKITNCEVTSYCNAACCATNSCTEPNPLLLFCSSLFATSACSSYVQGTVVSKSGHNWQCANANCANCATFSSCAPGASGCPWGTVWTDKGPVSAGCP